MRRRGFWLVLLSMTLGATAHAAVLVNGAGATFPYPLYSKWFDEFHQKHSESQINYQSIGSGGGIRQILEGTVDFGATDGSAPACGALASSQTSPSPSTIRVRIDPPPLSRNVCASFGE